MKLSKPEGARWFEKICCVDFETYYDDEFSLRKMSNTEYIRDERFHITAVGIQMSDWPRAKVYHGEDAAAALRQIDWSRTAFLAHHAHFDALIMTHVVGIKPCFYMDTLSMGRALHGNIPLNLDALAKLYGRGGKVHKQGLVNMKGVHDFRELPKDQQKVFIDYTADDVEDTMYIATRMLEQYPPEELQLIDLTVRMFAEPMININVELAWKVYEEEAAKKAALLKAAGITDEKELSSAARFQRLLEELGVDVPMKLSPTALKRGEEKLIPALAMGDIEFKEGLRNHPNETVRAAVEARIAVKSTLMQTRANAMIRRGVEPFPVYLKYCGAHTQRWSGGDGVNPQNLPRGSDLRRALEAPDGYMFNICDSAQIEARGNAWFSGQEDIVRAFRNYDTIIGYDADGKPKRAGPDVYRYTAAHSIYSKDIDLITDDERFVGKTCVLGLGYGMGYMKFRKTLKIGQFGPPVDMDLDRCQMIVKAWRASNKMIVQMWKEVESLMRQGFFGGSPATDGLLTFEEFKGDGYIHGPNGLYLRYRNIQLDEEGNMSYATRMGRTKLYGGLILENIIQWLSRIIIGEQMLQAQAELPIRIVTCTHDEIVGLSKKKEAEKVQEELTRIMSITPAWAAGWPLSADGVVNNVYVKK